MFSGRRSWCSISRRWKACRPRGDLLDDAAHASRGRAAGCRSSTARASGPRCTPSRRRGSCARASAGSGFSTCGLLMRRAIHSSMQEALEVAPGRPADRSTGVFSDDRLAGLVVDGEVEVAAAAGVELAHDAVAVERLRALEQRRRRQLAPAADAARRLAAPAARRRARSARSGCPRCRARYASATIARAAASRSPRAARIASAMNARVDVLVDAVGGEHEHVAALELQRAGSRSRAAALKPSARLR